MKELHAAIQRGDLETFAALCRRALEARDEETLEIALATIARLPSAPNVNPVSGSGSSRLL